jgi:tRNA G18 (ribose-2'-O)-methylase SpoU
MSELHLIAHNVRSAHNIGSLLRTAEGLGVGKVWISGYSPYPLLTPDTRLPHIARRVHAQISKTSLGAEDMIAWEHTDDVLQLITSLQRGGFTVAALEQAPGAQSLPAYKPPSKLALVVGREVEGIEQEVLAACDLALEIPMAGRKESFNVAHAAAMALYHLSLVGPQL